MKEELDLRDFDVLGIIELDDIQGIEWDKRYFSI